MSATPAINFELKGNKWPPSHRRYINDHMKRVSESAQSFLVGESLVPRPDATVFVLRSGKSEQDAGYRDVDGTIAIIFASHGLVHRTLNIAESTDTLVHEIVHDIRFLNDVPFTLGEHVFQEGLAHCAGFLAGDYVGDRRHGLSGLLAKAVGQCSASETKFISALDRLVASGTEAETMHEELMNRQTFRGGPPLGVAFGVHKIGRKILEGQRIVDLIDLPHEEIIGRY